MKSASGSAKPLPKKQEWRLSRTLRRATDYRPIEDDDLKYLWAAYKKGAFEQIERRDMTAAEFKTAFEYAVISQCSACWVLYGKTRKSFMPVGVVFATHTTALPFFVVSGAIWMPWASNRNIVESMVAFLNRVRREYQLQFYTLPEHRKLYEVCCKHGIVRRVGTSYEAMPGHAATVYETIRKDA